MSSAHRASAINPFLGAPPYVDSVMPVWTPSAPYWTYSFDHSSKSAEAFQRLFTPSK